MTVNQINIQVSTCHVYEARLFPGSVYETFFNLENPNEIPDVFYKGLLDLKAA